MQRSQYAPPALGALLLPTLCFLSACGTSHTEVPSEDAAIVFDATFSDAGPDAGPERSNVGESCGSDTDCAGGDVQTCIAQLPGGYCTSPCADDTGCPEDASCVMVQQGTSVCLAGCDTASTERQCRAGYGCSAQAGAGVCLPGCFDDTDCQGGQVCDPAASAGAGSCFNPESAIGDACSDAPDCPADTFCLAERFADWPGGACIAFGCDVQSGSGCPDDSVCIESGRGGICIDACAAESDCTRTGYTCTANGDFPDRTFCGPAFQADNLGQVCSARRGSCVGGACLSESETGFPDSYCVAAGCDPEAADTGCPGDGVCAPGEGGAFCLDGCTSGDDCRAGYACRPYDRADAASAMACMPGCQADSDCSAETEGGTAFVCNEGTGFCAPPLDSADLGQPCAGGDECVGGSCIADWPSGACGFPGCRLSGEGPSEACPASTVCTDDGEGDPTLGACLPTCEIDVTTCRSGYACVAQGDSVTEGACVPVLVAD